MMALAAVGCNASSGSRMDVISIAALDDFRNWLIREAA
jgi:hypothetical protein